MVSLQPALPVRLLLGVTDAQCWLQDRWQIVPGDVFLIDLRLSPDEACGLVKLPHNNSATPIQPDPPQPTRAAPPVDGLEAAITQTEVEKALLKLSNGNATGRAGWPAELLRHAAYHVTLDNGRKVKVWTLVSILASFLNACFDQGRLPACVSSALVTPIH